MRIIDADKVLLSIIKTQQEYEGMSRLVEDTDPYLLGAIIGLKDAAFEILNAIEVDAEPVKHGRWKKHRNEKTCSVCGFIYYSNNDDWNFCPNCGAKMMEVDNG